MEPSAGTARLHNLDLRTDAAEFRKLIGLVPQDIALYEDLNAVDNLMFYGQVFGLRGKQLREKIAWALDVAQLQDHRKKPVKNFSGGMKRRLNLVVGLLGDPKVLFLDEPTVGVDPQSRNFIFETIKRLAKQGMTCIYTTHYMEEAEALCDRVAIYDQGQIVALDTPAALVRELGEQQVTVTFDRTPAGVEEYLRQATDVTRVYADAQQLTVFTNGVAPVLSALQAIVAEQGLHLLEISSHRVNLETVFLELTGKKLKDAKE
jgi:ABC-2 type transport system ATP-binding protein